ncbi:MAG: spore coat protein [Clostridia bacterium]|nr:spore coat protein [Clostridia bacterium]
MAQITSKELSGLSDLLSMEQNLIAKYKQFAADAGDNALTAKYDQLACRHQRHYDELVSNLK